MDADVPKRSRHILGARTPQRNGCRQPAPHDLARGGAALFYSAPSPGPSAHRNAGVDVQVTSQQ